MSSRPAVFKLSIAHSSFLLPFSGELSITVFPSIVFRVQCRLQGSLLSLFVVEQAIELSCVISTLSIRLPRFFVPPKLLPCVLLVQQCTVSSCTSTRKVLHGDLLNLPNKLNIFCWHWVKFEYSFM